MSLITLRNAHLGFGGPAVLQGVDLRVERGERVCLVGRNGAGKSSLMRVLSGEVALDDGERSVAQGARIGHLPQEVSGGIAGRVFDVVAGALGELTELLREYQAINLHLQQQPNPELMSRLARVQHALEAAEGWSTEQRIETVLSRLTLAPDDDFKTLSGGVQRRVLLARALVTEPDLLLLDEPTNHLDIDTIGWLEEFLLGYRGSLLFVTHDRRFLQRLATRIIDLDRGQLRDWPGDYQNFLRRRDELILAESQERERFDKKLAQEEVWVRQGIKARRTRNEGRVRALKALRDVRQRRREAVGSSSMRLQNAGASGRLVVEVENVDYRWTGAPIIKGFSTTILRGDKVGVIGPNGVGKSTLLNLLLGRIAPASGRVHLGTRLEVAYFDQMRSQLQDDKSVQDNVADGASQVQVFGKSKHVIGYLQDFLFTPERARTPVRALSGGERNRLLLARLFARPANVLVLDEPTNDLDTDTLELLEDLLVAYSGTLLLVSHDRAFLDHVVTSCLVFEGDGRIGEYVGGYEEWVRQRAAPAPAGKSSGAKRPAQAPGAKPPVGSRKLGYKAQRELADLPAKIEAVESQLDSLQSAMGVADFYQQGGEAIAAANAQLGELQSQLAELYRRWEELEAAPR